MKKRRFKRGRSKLPGSDVLDGHSTAEGPNGFNVTTSSLQLGNRFSRQLFTIKSDTDIVGGPAWPGSEPILLPEGSLGSRFRPGANQRQTKLHRSKGAPPRTVGYDRSTSKLPRRDSEEDYIIIPAFAREWSLFDLPFPVRLQHILTHHDCGYLGQLQGLRFSRILRWRNMGPVTLHKLINFIKSIQQGDMGQGLRPDLTHWPNGNMC
jgi:hypothetical protein